MDTDSKLRKGVRIGYFTDSDNLSKNLKKYIKGDVTFFCIGTDRSTGDSLAPLIGSMLVEKGYKNVIGTLEYPVHATNIDERIKEVPSDTCVIAIDAALGREEGIGKLILNKGELQPGLALNKTCRP